MPILFSVVASERTILSHFASCEGNFMEIAEQVVSKLPECDNKMTYSHGIYLLHYIIENSYIYFCITDKLCQRSRTFLFLNEIQRRFLNRKNQTTAAFARVLAEEMYRYSEDYSTITIRKGELDELNNIGVGCSEDLLGEKILFVDNPENISYGTITYLRKSPDRIQEPVVTGTSQPEVVVTSITEHVEIPPQNTKTIESSRGEENSELHEIDATSKVSENKETPTPPKHLPNSELREHAEASELPKHEATLELSEHVETPELPKQITTTDISESVETPVQQNHVAISKAPEHVIAPDLPESKTTQTLPENVATPNLEEAITSSEEAITSSEEAITSSEEAITSSEEPVVIPRVYIVFIGMAILFIATAIYMFGPISCAIVTSIVVYTVIYTQKNVHEKSDNSCMVNNES